MGLQVWLPLTKDLHNQGLTNTTATVTGTTSFAAGKLGQALSCNGSSYWSLPNLTLGSSASIACWCKTTVSGKMPWVLESDANNKLNFYWASIYTLNTGDSNNNPFQTDEGNSINVLNDGIWHHFIVTFNGSAAKLYIDGIYAGKAKTFRNPTSTNKTIKLAGGYNGGHSYDWNGMINDFRVYDNCLSEKEIKEISQGLILHYPLNRRGMGNENIFKNSDKGINFNGSDYSSVTTRTFDSTTGIGRIQIVTANTNWNAWHFGGSDTSISTATLSSGVTTYVFSVDVRITNYSSGDIRFGFDFRTNNVVSVRGSHTLTTTEKNGNWHRISCSLTTNSTSDTQCLLSAGGSGNAGTVIEYKHFKLEQSSVATSWCPNSADIIYNGMNLGSTIEYDYSGFNNNSTYNSFPTYLSDAPKYHISTYFGGVNTPKATLDDPSILTVLNNCSIAWWENCTTTGNTLLFSGQTQSYYIAAGNNSNPLYDYNIGTSGITLYKDGVEVNTSYNGQRVNHTGTYHIKDEWHHYVLTGINLSTWTTFIINGYTSWPLNSYVSDVRIYATALSATDVLSLYHNNAYIDQSGQIYGPVR